MKKLKLMPVFAILFFVSCEDKDEVVDVTAPTIQLNEPVNGEMFEAGDTIHFDALFEDDVELAAYNISIHSNFDGHSHGRIAVSPFVFSLSSDLTGKSDNVHEEIPVTEDATAGPYHLVVESIDSAGNSTFADGTSKEIEIWVTNDEMAGVHFQDANGIEVSEYEAEAGVPIHFYGVIEDLSGTLDHVEVMVGHQEVGASHDHEHEGGRIGEEEAIFEQEFEVGGKTSVYLQNLLTDAAIVVEQEHVDELEEGEHLYLTVRVSDEDGNISSQAIAIHFD